MHTYQRLTYYDIKQFLEKPSEGCKIAVLTGIRRIGKTGVLTDLNEKLSEVMHTRYVSFSRNNDIKAEMSACLAFVEQGTGVLFVDEITQYPKYEDIVKHIEHEVYNNGKDLRVVFTGSSSLHLLSLKSGILGGGRAKLFRMTFLSFAEYLVFTGRRKNYRCIESKDITIDDFKNYLRLEGLKADGLKISFDREYMAELYKDIELSNQSSLNPGAFSAITENDITCILDLISFTIGNSSGTGWDILRNPTGSRELPPLGVTDIDTNNAKWQGLRIYLSAQQLKSGKIRPENVARALYYLIVTNLAFVEVEYTDTNKVSASKLARILYDITTNAELERIFAVHKIFLVSPIWYLRIAKEVVEQYGHTTKELLDTRVIGGVLENYIKGSYCRWQTHQYEYEITEIGSTKKALTNEERSRSIEVDLCDTHRSLLCEITSYNKNRGDVHLMKHFQDCDFIRILATRDVDTFSFGTHKIPYPKLCAMVDTGDVFKLEKRKNTTVNATALQGVRSKPIAQPKNMASRLNHRQKAVLLSASTVSVSRAEYAKVYDISKSTAADDLEELVKLGYFLRQTEKSGAYRYCKKML